MFNGSSSLSSSKDCNLQRIGSRSSKDPHPTGSRNVSISGHLDGSHFSTSRRGRAAGRRLDRAGAQPDLYSLAGLLLRGARASV